MILTNKITLIRILAIPCFVVCLMYYEVQREYFSYIALAIFVLAVVTDAIDGFIARRLNQYSELGSYLDPIADKLLIVIAFISLSMMDNLPAKFTIPGWATLLVITRDGIIFLGSILIYLIKGKFKVAPSYFGKVTTFFQMFTIIFILSNVPFWRIVLYLAVFFTVLSGADYIRRGNKLLND